MGPLDKLHPFHMRTLAMEIHLEGFINLKVQWLMHGAVFFYLKYPSSSKTCHLEDILAHTVEDIGLNIF